MQVNICVIINILHVADYFVRLFNAKHFNLSRGVYISMYVFSWDLGGGNSTIISEKTISLNTWTTLRLLRHNMRVEMFFNQRRVAMGSSPSLQKIANLHTTLSIGKVDKLLADKEFVFPLFMC